MCFGLVVNTALAVLVVMLTVSWDILRALCTSGMAVSHGDVTIMTSHRAIWGLVNNFAAVAVAA